MKTCGVSYGTIHLFSTSFGGIKFVRRVGSRNNYYRTWLVGLSYLAPSGEENIPYHIIQRVDTTQLLTHHHIGDHLLLMGTHWSSLLQLAGWTAFLLCFE